MTSRHLAAAVFAVGTGLVLAWMDSRPGFDATGLTVAGLVLAGLASVVIAGTRRLIIAAALGLLVGMWLPLAEIATPAGSASLAAPAFAVGGALIGAAIRRGLGSAAAA